MYFNTLELLWKPNTPLPPPPLREKAVPIVAKYYFPNKAFTKKNVETKIVEHWKTNNFASLTFSLWGCGKELGHLEKKNKY